MPDSFTNAVCLQISDPKTARVGVCTSRPFVKAADREHARAVAAHRQAGRSIAVPEQNPGYDASFDFSAGDRIGTGFLGAMNHFGNLLAPGVAADADFAKYFIPRARNAGWTDQQIGQYLSVFHPNSRFIRASEYDKTDPHQHLFYDRVLDYTPDEAVKNYARYLQGRGFDQQRIQQEIKAKFGVDAPDLSTDANTSADAAAKTQAETPTESTPQQPQAPAESPPAAAPTAPPPPQTPEWQTREWQNNWFNQYRGATREQRTQMLEAQRAQRANMNAEQGAQFDKVMRGLNQRYQRSRTGIYLADGTEWRRGGPTQGAVVYPQNPQAPQQPTQPQTVTPPVQTQATTSPAQPQQATPAPQNPAQSAAGTPPVSSPNPPVQPPKPPVPATGTSAMRKTSSARLALFAKVAQLKLAQARDPNAPVTAPVATGAATPAASKPVQPAAGTPPAPTGATAPQPDLRWQTARGQQNLARNWANADAATRAQYKTQIQNMARGMNPATRQQFVNTVRTAIRQPQQPAQQVQQRAVQQQPRQPVQRPAARPLSEQEKQHLQQLGLTTDDVAENWRRVDNMNQQALQAANNYRNQVTGFRGWLNRTFNRGPYSTPAPVRQPLTAKPVPPRFNSRGAVAAPAPEIPANVRAKFYNTRP